MKKSGKKDKEKKKAAQAAVLNELWAGIDEGGDDIPKKYKSVRAEIRAEFGREISGAGELGRGQRLPAILTRDECRQLFSAYTSGKWAFRNNLIIRVLYSTGIRIEEMQNLKFVDIIYNTSNVFIRAGKGEKDRYCCIDADTMNLLKKWQTENNFSGSDFVTGLSLRQIRRIVEGAGDITGISKKYEDMDRVFSAHSLRHAFATHSYENGMRLLTLKKLMGHEYLGTTEIYVYTSMWYDTEEYKRTGPFEEGETK